MGQGRSPRASCEHGVRSLERDAGIGGLHRNRDHAQKVRAPQFLHRRAYASAAGGHDDHGALLHPDDGVVSRNQPRAGCRAAQKSRRGIMAPRPHLRAGRAGHNADRGYHRPVSRVWRHSAGRKDTLLRGHNAGQVPARLPGMDSLPGIAGRGSAVSRDLRRTGRNRRENRADSPEDAYGQTAL